MKSKFSIVCAVVFVTAVSSRGDSPKDDLAKLQGGWTMVYMEDNGKKQTADKFMEFSREVKGATYTITIETSEGVQTIGGKIKLDPSKSPKAIDVELTEGAKGKRLGLYKFENVGSPGTELEFAL